MRYSVCVGALILCMSASAVMAGDTPVLNTGPISAFIQRQNTDAEKFSAEVRTADRQFRLKLRAMDQKDRPSAVEERRLSQYRHKEAFRRQQHDEAMAFLGLRLAATDLSAADRQGLLNVFDVQYKDVALLGSQQREESMLFFDTTAADRTLTSAQKREALLSFFQQQKARTFLERQQRDQQKQAELQKKYSLMSGSPTVQSR